MSRPNNSNHAASVDPSAADIDAKLGTLSKTSRTLEIFFIIVAIAFAALAIVPVALLVANAIAAGSTAGISFEPLFSSFTFLLFGAIFLAASYVFRDISHGESPFTQKQARRIRTISWLLFAYAIVDSLIPKGMVIGGDAVGRGLSVMRFDSGYVVVNVAMFVAAVVFFFLSLVFKYGVALQDLSDDTV